MISYKVVIGCVTAKTCCLIGYLVLLSHLLRFASISPFALLREILRNRTVGGDRRIRVIKGEWGTCLPAFKMGNISRYTHRIPGKISCSTAFIA